MIDIETSRVSPWIGLSISQTRTAKCCVPWCLSLPLGAELGLRVVDKGSISVHSRFDLKNHRAAEIALLMFSILLLDFVYMFPYHQMYPNTHTYQRGHSAGHNCSAEVCLGLPWGSTFICLYILSHLHIITFICLYIYIYIWKLLIYLLLENICFDSNSFNFERLYFLMFFLSNKYKSV